MTTTLQKKLTETTTTTQLFPMEVSCEQQSLIYIKRLTAVAISNILYLRNVFNEECYGHRKLDSIKLRILSERSETVGASQIVQWVKGCFDAMEKKYLKQLTLGIFTDCSKPEELIEAYTFRFNYENSSTHLNVSFKDQSIANSEQDLHRTTTQLLRSLIILTQSLDKLPDDCYLTMKLLYYDDITPPDYEPPGFVPSETDTFTFKGRPISINAGEVSTPHHTLKLKIRTDNKQFEDFVPTQDSRLMKDSQTDSQDNRDDSMTPMKIDYKSSSEMIAENERSTNLENRMASTSRSTQSEVRPRMSTSTPNRFDYDLLRSAAEQALNQSSERYPQFVRPNPVSNARNSIQKTKEKSVITKIQDLKVVEENEQIFEPNSNKRKVIALEPMDYEVSQDSLFDKSHENDKRFKASKTGKTIPIGQRGKIRV